MPCVHGLGQPQHCVSSQVSKHICKTVHTSACRRYKPRDVVRASGHGSRLEHMVQELQVGDVGVAYRFKTKTLKAMCGDLQSAGT